MNDFMKRVFHGIPPVTLNLIILNLIIWLAEITTGEFGYRLVDLLGLHYWGASGFYPFQLLTSMFVHDNHTIIHVFFNMFTLYMFGRMLEHVWGSKRFLFFYLVCGVGAAFVQEIVWHFTWLNDYIDGIARLNGKTPETMKSIMNADPAYFADAIADFKDSIITIGASGAVFGVLLGFAFVFPNLPLYIFFIPIPIKAKYMVIGYAVLEFFLGFSRFNSDPVAHFAHLGGMIFGLILLLYWKHRGKLRGNFF